MIYKKLVLKGSQKIWFISDTHFSHKNICRGTTTWHLRGSDIHSSTREFKNPNEMNSHIIDNINRYVLEDDWLVHLGDWSFGGEQEIVKSRNKILCKNIILILGNHDHHIANKEQYKVLFESVHSYLELTVSNSVYGKKTYNLLHFPLSVWNKAHHGRIHLHGHTHSSYVGEGKMLDVGVDNAYKLLGEYRPFSQKDINDSLIERKFVQKSHHNKNTN